MTVYVGSQALKGEKRIEPVRRNTSGTNPTGLQYGINLTQGDDIRSGCV